ncbi:5-(carboxyamino)imidazole ribonucleotide synthase [Novosphingobium lentum]|uniref:5-(carboxyamino)imidazole ribonucleotide synthase n=1 Tax=Novosphingobium lentum TaxID=145287 RepID=UPI00083537E2|nr:5-(carboxyamino)imidazole ribonucleotide synthase [Novosphingobium lentum]
MIPPGETIGILGGGQLGRMLALAAAQLGYRCHVFAPERDSIAADVCAEFTCAAWDDRKALETFAKSCAVVTYEFENVPVEPLAAVKVAAPLHPPRRALEIAQDRFTEKRYAEDLGGVPVAFAPVGTVADLRHALGRIGLPGILKTRRDGYDGKGQQRIADDVAAHDAMHAFAGHPAIYEAFVEFEAEFSVILVRGADGDIRFWDSAENVHARGILSRSTVPASPLVQSQIADARGLATRVAEALSYVGVLTLEFFATPLGPLFNEMAPRVHNSGHWTIEGALTSQFENHIRAICGLPLGDTSLACKGVVMDNLIGDAAHDWAQILSDPANHLHLYGKAAVRPGRKMGHVTRLLL